MRKLLFLLCLCLVVPSVSLAYAESDLVAIVHQVADSVVTIRNSMSMGSGFIVHPSGYIISNEHVVGSNKEVKVAFADGKTLPGEVLVADSVRDIAIIKVPRVNLPVVTLGDSSSVEPGETVIAVGHPMGMENTITRGIVSANNRPHRGKKYIQIDAALNPGNSGGPVIDGDGNVIGVSVMTMGFAESIGFAIPINDVLTILNSHRIPASVILSNQIAQRMDVAGASGVVTSDTDKIEDSESDSGDFKKGFFIFLGILFGIGVFITLAAVILSERGRRRSRMASIMNDSHSASVSSEDKTTEDLHIELK